MGVRGHHDESRRDALVPVTQLAEQIGAEPVAELVIHDQDGVGLRAQTACLPHRVGSVDRETGFRQPVHQHLAKLAEVLHHQHPRRLDLVSHRVHDGPPSPCSRCYAP